MFEILKAKYQVWRERRRLKGEIAHLPTSPTPDGSDKLSQLQGRLEYLEAQVLLWKAERLGIDIPYEKNQWWGSAGLNSAGRHGMAKLIRDENRKTIEWWVKTVGGILPLITGLAGLVGVIIGLISILSR